MRALLCACAVCYTLCARTALSRRDLDFTVNDKCKNCDENHFVNVDVDFNRLKADPDTAKHASEILSRLKVFKVPVHPRIRLFHELLKVAMDQHARRTADSLYVPDKYNVALNT